MIKVIPAEEPESFDKEVRQPGLDALREMIGLPPVATRRGPRRKKIADKYEEIPSDKFPPFWQNAIPEMRIAYNGICAYLAVHIWPGTGDASVDHMAAKSTDWNVAYEWDNYRLACGLMNSRKNKYDDVHDPFVVVDGLFTMEFVEYQLLPGPLATAADLPAIRATIKRLNLNSDECCKARGGYVEEYRKGHIDFDFLSRKAPFVALEMHRHGEIIQKDLPEADAFAARRAAL